MRPLILITTLLLVGCYDSGFEMPRGDGTVEARTLELTQLQALYAGQTFRVESDVVISGLVSTSDKQGNFYKSLCIEQDGAAVEIMVGLDRLHNDYPMGTRLTVGLKGLAVGQSFGVIQIGRYPTAGSWFATDYIGSTRAAVDLHVQRGGDRAEVIAPQIVRIEELTPKMCGKLIKIEELSYSPQDIAEATWMNYTRFTDQNGAEIYTYVREYADFATQNVPYEQLSLSGVLQYDTKNGGRYMIKLRDEMDFRP